MSKRRRALSHLIVITLLSIAANTRGQSSHVDSPPEQLNDGWEVSSLSAEGIDPAPIEAISARIADIDDIENLLSMLIVKNGKLVHEAYSPYVQRNTLYWMASITKTVSSTLIGIAIDKGYISGVDAAVADLLPEYADAVADPRFGEIQLKHVMTMSTGLEWFEHGSSYNDPRNSEHLMVDSEDWIRYVLSHRVRDEPGTVFLYNTGAMQLLSAVIKSATGVYINQFAEEHLFHPLGIYAYQWNRDSTGYPCTGGTDGGVGLRSRDLAKIGWLFLYDGTWRGRRVISKEWIKEATRGHMEMRGGRYYGYNWFPGSMSVGRDRVDYVATFGYGGQTLYLVPELDLILVFTCELSEPGVNTRPLALEVFEAVSR
jgi:CubicO group peptidase (beta-lactamase class C family)